MNKFKNCRICGLIKPLEEFNKKSDSKDGYRNDCKECRKKWRRENREEIIQKKHKYYKENREIILKKSIIYRKNNKKKISQQRKGKHKKFPWKKIYQHIIDRCNNPNNEAYKYYGGRGIKCLITEEEIKQLMIRDNYWGMKKPSIDRIDNDGNYSFENCRFIELSENIAKDRRRKILQFDLQGNFIKEWESIVSACKFLNIKSDAIGCCLRKLSKTSGGFKWKYKVK